MSPDLNQGSLFIHSNADGDKQQECRAEDLRFLHLPKRKGALQLREIGPTAESREEVGRETPPLSQGSLKDSLGSSQIHSAATYPDCLIRHLGLELGGYGGQDW